MKADSGCAACAGFVGHESSEPKTQSGWADTSKIYGEKSSTKLANGTRVSLPAMPHTLGRDWTPSPTSVLQQPFSPENSYNSSMSFFSRSPSPVHAQGGKAIVLRQAARQTRMASPLPGGYIASSLPSTAIVKSPMRSPIGWRSSSSDRPDQVQSPLGQEILDRVATSEDHQDDKKINDWVHQYKKENVRYIFTSCHRTPSQDIQTNKSFAFFKHQTACCISLLTNDCPVAAAPWRHQSLLGHGGDTSAGSSCASSCASVWGFGSVSC